MMMSSGFLSFRRDTDNDVFRFHATHTQDTDDDVFMCVVMGAIVYLHVSMTC